MKKFWNVEKMIGGRIISGFDAMKIRHEQLSYHQPAKRFPNDLFPLCLLGRICHQIEFLDQRF
jgi:hypothetical protein